MNDHLRDVRTELREQLRAGGLRATASRLAVMLALHERQAPMSHDEVMAVLGDGAFDKASIWRILADLADSGLLRRMDLGDRVWRYELLDACRPVQATHPHFLCDDCGTIACLPPLQLRSAQGRLPDILRGADVNVHVTGTCASCRA